jgi:O-antigen/teichoic acid export membrane protein
VHCLLAAIIYFGYSGTGYLGSIQRVVWFLPVGVLSICISSMLIQLNIKQGAFKFFAGVVAAQALFTIVPQIGLGLLHVDNALILGVIAGSVFSNVVFVWLFFKRNSIGHVRRETTWQQLLATAKEHVNFPRYTLGGDAISVLAQQFVPVFVLALFSPALAGLYSFSTRIVRVPLLIVSTAIAGALRKEAVDHVNGDGDLTSLFSATVRALFLIGFVPFVVLLLFSDQIFAVVFGNQWRDAGTVVRILSPGILFEFVAFPLSVFFLVTNRQRYTFRIQVTGFVLLVLALVIGKYRLNDFMATCYLLSAVMVVVNLTTIALTASVIGRPAAKA